MGQNIRCFGDLVSGLLVVYCEPWEWSLKVPGGGVLLVGDRLSRWRFFCVGLRSMCETSVSPWSMKWRGSLVTVIWGE